MYIKYFSRQSHMLVMWLLHTSANREEKMPSDHGAIEISKKQHSPQVHQNKVVSKIQIMQLDCCKTLLLFAERIQKWPFWTSAGSKPLLMADQAPHSVLIITLCRGWYQKSYPNGTGGLRSQLPFRVKSWPSISMKEPVRYRSTHLRQCITYLWILIGIINEINNGIFKIEF